MADDFGSLTSEDGAFLRVGEGVEEMFKLRIVGRYTTDGGSTNRGPAYGDWTHDAFTLIDAPSVQSLAVLGSP